MIAPLTTPIVDKQGIAQRIFADFLTTLSNYTVPKGAIVLFFGTIPSKGWEEVTTLIPPIGYKYGKKI